MAPEWNREALLASSVLASLRPVLRACPPERFPAAEDLSRLAAERGLGSGGGAPLRFVRAAPQPSGSAVLPYEASVYRGEVPTRPNNSHDLFNALAWLAFPQTKALLNRRHYEHMAARRQDPRGTARDVLTLFDESGMIVACSDPELSALLRGFKWKALFWSRRSVLAQGMTFLSFGHAIHEKALRPYKALTAKALIVDVAGEFHVMPLDAQLAEADALAARRLSEPDALTATALLAPLPILGIPGWDPGNERESFYDDAAVFRPGRISGRAGDRRGL